MPPRSDTIAVRPGAKWEVGTGVLTYRDEDHTYWLDGVRIPSVTQVLALSGLGVPDDVPRDLLAKAAAKGTFIHKACELYDEGDLDETSVPEEWRGYVQAWARFKEERVARVLAVEEMRYAGEDDEHPCAGTLDRRVVLHGDNDVETTLDLKTGSRLQPVTALQLAAYDWMLGCVTRRRAVLLKEDGTYQEKEYDHPRDHTLWHACRVVAHWRIANDPKVRREYEGKGRKAA